VSVGRGVWGSDKKVDLVFGCNSILYAPKLNALPLRTHSFANHNPIHACLRSVLLVQLVQLFWGYIVSKYNGQF